MYYKIKPRNRRTVEGAGVYLRGEIGRTEPQPEFYTFSMENGMKKNVFHVGKNYEWHIKLQHWEMLTRA